MILRYFNVAGATERLGEIHRPETHLIPNVLRAAEGGPALTLFGEDYPTPDGTPIRDYIHVSDLADAHVAALEATDLDDARTGPPGGGSTEPVIATSARPPASRSGMSCARRRRSSGRRSRTPSGRAAPGDPPVLVASNDRAREILGWTPRRSTLAEMIGSAWAWRRAHPDGYGD